MRRQEFITLLGGAAARPFAARAQQGERMRRIGVLMPFTERDLEAQTRVNAFHAGLQKLGWTQGRNIRIGYRWAPDPTLRRISMHSSSTRAELRLRGPH